MRLQPLKKGDAMNQRYVDNYWLCSEHLVFGKIAPVQTKKHAANEFGTVSKVPYPI
jgi:hypothetical protein